MTIKMNDIWIGMVRLSGSPENEILSGSPGAYSCFLAIADSEASFSLEAITSARGLGLSIDEILWSEPLSRRLEQYEIETDLLDISNLVRIDNNSRFGEFHTWTNEN